MTIKIYKTDGSPPARAVMMVCEIFNVPVEYVDVNLFVGEARTPEFLKRNPLHTVPVLEDGDLTLHDSHAIMTYLVDSYGKDSSLYPKDVKQRALVNQKLYLNNSVLFPRVRNVTVPAFVEGVKGITDKKLKDTEEAYEFLEAFLSNTKFLAGENITIADIAAYATVCALVYIQPLNAERFPKLSAWVKELEKQPYAQKVNAPGAKLLGEAIKTAISS